MLGSRAWVGTLSAQQLSDVRNKHGQNYWQAGANYGASADAWPAIYSTARRIAG